MGITIDPDRALLLRVAFDHGAMSLSDVAEWVTSFRDLVANRHLVAKLG